ncbi:MAG TPA: cytidylyltransferase [Acidimicrobiaceae bacterium]|nr:cytidylyltransferase [Acidimicrobiaceae bacterium]|tara:strand:+ start:691 stop:1431 length:741 start_codon:yes stop_codon:yes gene_type:complete
MTGTIALIPARSGSKGVPAKNIRPLGGRPLLAWTIAAALRSASIDRVIVSTDSEEYAELALDHGAEVPFLRPAELASDHSRDVEFILHALDWLIKNEGVEPELLVHLRPTTPFRSPTDLDAAVDLMRTATSETNQTPSAVRSVHEMSTTAYKCMEIDGGLLRQVGAPTTALDRANDPRQDFPVTYLANGYVDVLSTAFVRATGLLHGDRVVPFLTPLALEVDTEADFELLQRHFDLHPELADQLFG